ncbi:hypothetical protein Tco_0426270 [Tanacetum coccineum]
MVSNQIRPPGFPPIQNPHANSQNNFNRGNNFNQNRGNNFNQGQIYRPPVNQPVTHQGPAPQTHGWSGLPPFQYQRSRNEKADRNVLMGCALHHWVHGDLSSISESSL